MPSYHSSSDFQVESDDCDGAALADLYQMLEELGAGSFGVVYKAIDKNTGEIVAVKHVRRLFSTCAAHTNTFTRSTSKPQKKTLPT